MWRKVLDKQTAQNFTPRYICQPKHPLFVALKEHYRTD
jgi:hypothetical protein